MKRIEAVELYKALTSIPNRDYNRFLLYSIEKSKISLLEVAQDVTNRERVVIDLVDRYENARKALVEKYCEKDSEGRPIIEADKYTLSPENESVVYNEINSMRSQLNIDFKISEFESYVQEDVSVELVKTSFKYIPEQIDSKLFATLMNLVKETSEELAELVG